MRVRERDVGFVRGEKKVISGKSVVKSAVTSLIWPGSQSNYVVGLADGKVGERVCVGEVLFVIGCR